MIKVNNLKKRLSLSDCFTIICKQCKCSTVHIGDEEISCLNCGLTFDNEWGCILKKKEE